MTFFPRTTLGFLGLPSQNSAGASASSLPSTANRSRMFVYSTPLSPALTAVPSENDLGLAEAQPKGVVVFISLAP